MLGQWLTPSGSHLELIRAPYVVYAFESEPRTPSERETVQYIDLAPFTLVSGPWVLPVAEWIPAGGRALRPPLC